MFGGGHVRTSPQHFGRDRNVTCDCHRDRGHGLEQCVDGSWRRASQHREPVQRGRQCLLAQRNRRGRLRTQLSRLFEIECADESGLHAPLHDLQRLVLGTQVRPCYRQLALRQPGIHVVERDLGGDRELCRVQVRLDCREVGLGGLHGPALSTEQVEFVAGVEAGVVGRSIRYLRVRTNAHEPGRRRAEIERRPRSRASALERRASLPDPGARRIDVRVGSERLLDELGENRIVESVPPVREFSGVRGLWRRRRLKAGRHPKRFRRRRPRLRADRTSRARHDREQQQGQA